MNKFDPIAVVVDWLDTCRTGEVDPLMKLYHVNATLACGCSGNMLLSGADAIKAYWRPKLAARAQGSFEMLDVNLERAAVVLEYLSFDGQRVNKRFSFNDAGQILHSECSPAALASWNYQEVRS